MTSNNSIHYKIHQLVLLSIADHFTRIELNESNEIAIGLLYGEKENNFLSIEETIDCAFKFFPNKTVQINLDSLSIDQRLFQECYPTSKPVGFYCATKNSFEQSYQIIESIHNQLVNIFNGSCVVVIHMNVQETTNDSILLPIKLFSIDSNSFTILDWSLASSETESICSLEIANQLQEQSIAIEIPNENGSTSSINSEIISFQKKLVAAMSDFRHKIVCFENNLNQFRTLSEPSDSDKKMDIFASIQQFCESLQNSKLNTRTPLELIKSFNNTLLMLQLSTMTKSLMIQNEVNNRFAFYQSSIVERDQKTQSHGVKREQLIEIEDQPTDSENEESSDHNNNVDDNDESMLSDGNEINHSIDQSSNFEKNATKSKSFFSGKHRYKLWSRASGK